MTYLNIYILYIFFLFRSWAGIHDERLACKLKLIHSFFSFESRPQTHNLASKTGIATSLALQNAVWLWVYVPVRVGPSRRATKYQL